MHQCQVGHSNENEWEMGRGKLWLECAGVGGSLFWENSAQQGSGAAKQGLGAARDRVFTKTVQQTF